MQFIETVQNTGKFSLIPYPAEQRRLRILIRTRTGADSHTRKPVRPVLIQMPFDSDALGTRLLESLHRRSHRIKIEAALGFISFLGPTRFEKSQQIMPAQASCPQTGVREKG